MKRNITSLLLILFLLLSCLLISCTENESTKETTDGGTTAETTEKVLTEEEKLYKNAKDAIVELDEKIKKDIFEAQDTKHRLSWFDIDSEYAHTGTGMRCYGVFGDCAVLFEATQLTEITTKIVAGSTFQYSSSFVLYAYHENTLYPLEEAYEIGLISREDIETSAENHRLVEAYLFSLIRSVYE